MQGWNKSHCRNVYMADVGILLASAWEVPLNKVSKFGPEMSDTFVKWLVVKLHRIGSDTYTRV